MFVCVASSFINNGIVLLLCSANLKYAPWPISEFKFLDYRMNDVKASACNEPFVDLSGRWYLDIGSSITKTMLLQAIFPCLEFCFWYTLKIVKKLLDKSCFFRKTKCKT